VRRPILLIAAVLTGALVALVVVGVRVLDRDRDRLYERYARERLHILEEAGRMLARDVREVAVDLDLAAALLEQVDTDLLAERELQAVATIKREYLMLEALRTDGRRLRVVAADAPRGIDARVGPAVADLLARAARAPGTLEVSDALGSGDDPASWYRVIARWPPGHQDAIAAVVDARVLSRLPRRAARPDVEPVRRRRSPHHAAGGRPAGGDRRTTLRAGALPPPLYPLVDRARREGAAVEVLDPMAAAVHALPVEAPVAVAVTVRIPALERARGKRCGAGETRTGCDVPGEGRGTGSTATPRACRWQPGSPAAMRAILTWTWHFYKLCSIK